MNIHNKILIIKLSALGDFIQAMGPMKAIRNHHPDAHITLMTTKAFAGIGEKSGYFNDVYIDTRPKWFQLSKWFHLKSWLNGQKFDRVYDLQNNDRTNMYFKLLSSKPEWVGIAEGASHQNTSTARTSGHAFYGHKQTLALAGINNIVIDALKWMDGDISSFNLPSKFYVAVPGCAPSRPEKRWSAENYITVINKLDHPCILIGTKDDREPIEKITKACGDKVINLCGQTNLYQIPALGRAAIATIGNDTGPMHIVALTGCKTVVVFNDTPQSNPQRHAPLGPNVEIISAPDLRTISPGQVLAVL